MTAINRGFFISAVVSAVLVRDRRVPLPARLVQRAARRESQQLDLARQATRGIVALGAVLIGIVLAGAIQLLTGYFTETNRRPVKDVAKTSLTGPATVILSGISLGLESAVYSALLIGAAVYGAFLLGGGIDHRVAVRGGAGRHGLLTTVGVIVSMDTFGPVSDNAQGIAEMSGDVDGEGAKVLTSSTRSATPPRPSPRASRSRPPCSPRPRCSGRSDDGGGHARSPRRNPGAAQRLRRSCNLRRRRRRPTCWSV